MVRTFDALVVGAGIVGASVAYHLAERGMKVAVLEAESAPATGATGKSAGGIRVQFALLENARLSAESLEILEAFEARFGVDPGYRPIGYLFLVPDGQWPAWRSAMARLREAGLPVEEVGLVEAARRVPFISEGMGGATFGPKDGVFDPSSVAQGFLRAARDLGAELFLETPLKRAQRVGEAWRVETPRGAFEAPVVVNAAGAWAGEVARRAGLVLPVVPVRRSIYLTGPFDVPEWPMVVDQGSGVYFRPEGRRLLFGASNPEEPPGFREGVDWQWFIEVLLKARDRFPWFEELGFDKKAAWWGYYAETPDKNAILGPHPGAPGFYHAAGFSGHGAQQAPAVGRRLARWILEGEEPLLSRFVYDRFLRGEALTETGVV